MAKPLTVLLVDDNVEEADAIVGALREGGFEPSWRRVDSPGALRDALDAQSWDVVLSEYAPPGFAGLQAHSILCRSQASTPFIVVARALHDEAAVQCIERGIESLVLKDNLDRLTTAIERAVAAHAERREHEALLRQLRQAQKMEAIGRLAGGVAHDFNNLLTVIQGYGNILKRRLVPRGECVEEIGELLGATERAAGLTRQLLAFSRSQALKPQVLDVGQHVLGVQKMLDRVIGEDVELAVDLSPETGHVRADPGQLEQVLMNLAVNARDAMPEGGRITIRADALPVGPGDIPESPGLRPGMYVRIRVEDDGTGMDPETARHIFEPFFTTKEEGKGTGLGLATVFGIVRQSRGAIRVRSRLGQGTTIEVFLPQVPGEEIGQAVVDEAAGDETGSGTILLVEDEDAVRGLLRSELERVGYDVLPASDGEDAWNQMEGRGEPVDLVVTDVVMPRLRGPDLARKLREKWPKLRVLFVSGWQDPDRTRLPELDHDTRFLQKPFDPEKLISVVGEMLEPAPPTNPDS